jgi:RNA polymerase sigma-70 factor (ECF subfamily)
MGEAGTEMAFDAFFNYSWPRLQSQAYVLTGSIDEAQDLTQETLVRAWRHWDRVSVLDNPEAWARKVLHNLCIASWRKSQRQRSKHEVTTHAEIPDSHMEIAQAMRSLPGLQMRALLLHDGLGMTVGEVALELGVPDGTVKSWLSRSRKVVAERMGRLDHDPTRR